MSGTTVEPDAEATDVSWRERAVERSLRSARAKAESRSARFIETAVEILAESGRTDFTVQELVERSKTSLRSFYQHFTSKDELLLALFEEIIASSVDDWRTVTADMDSLSGLHFLVEMTHGRTGKEQGAGINRALSTYHLQLADSRPQDYARVLTPMRDMILELVERGVSEGVLRNDIDPQTLSLILMQTIVGAAHMGALRTELATSTIDTDRLWDFLVGGLIGGNAPAPAPAKPARRTRKQS